MMKMPANVKPMECLLVISGFVAWFALGNAISGTVWDSFGIANLGGTLIFFVIAFFIAERPQGTFVNRSQVIGVAAFLLWLGLNQMFVFGEHNLRSQLDSTESNLLIGISSLAAPFVFYCGAIFLIRGFHADPAYAVEEVKEKATEENRR